MPRLAFVGLAMEKVMVEDGSPQLERGPREGETHLGDGVYASYDGTNYIWLRVQRLGCGHETVAIEPETLSSLLRFASKCDERFERAVRP